MTAPPLDDFLLRHAPRPPAPVAPELLDLRVAINTALAALGAVGDDALERPWPWREIEADVRYGFYRQYEALEGARAVARRLLADARSQEPPARALVAVATAARWDLHGLLAGLSDEVLDADPGGGEWTVRQTLAHIVSGQRAYGWFTAWWLGQRGLPEDAFPAQVPDELGDLLPDEAVEGEGSLADIRRRFDDIVDLSAGALGGLDEAEIEAPARWAGRPVTVGFRIVRWSSHIREHTIQVEKTLAMLDRRPSEVERLLRLIAAAYGRLEEELYMWPEGLASATPAIERATLAARDAARDALTIRAAAEGSPVTD